MAAPSNSTTADGLWSTCELCGCVVSDTILHATWHNTAPAGAGSES